LTTRHPSVLVPVDVPLQEVGRFPGGKTGISLALLLPALIAYLPFLPIPLISDDYTQIYLARQYGPTDAWGNLLQDALYRCRATSLLVSYWVDRWLGVSILAFNLVNLFFHLLNTWLVYRLGRHPLIGYRVSFWAALFFGIYEGHQEAVVWHAALPELLVFLFGLLALDCWIRWLESGGRAYSLASLLLFVLALFSKESAVAFVPLFFGAWWISPNRQRNGLYSLAGYSVLSAVYAASIFSASKQHLHLNDGTFNWQSTFWLTLPNSVGRMLWFWGALALIALVVMRPNAWRRLLGISLFWMVVTLVPYSFLAYMNRVPSRHTYLASAGLALLVGAAMLVASERLRQFRNWHMALLAVLLLHNCGYLWIKKLPQYQRRAEPTERFLNFAANSEQPIAVQCVPYALDVYIQAAQLVLNRPSTFVVDASRGYDPSSGAVPYCDPSKP